MELSAYEQERLQRIEQNQQLLASLGLQQDKLQLQEAIHSLNAQKSTSTPKRRRTDAIDGATARSSKSNTPLFPTRASRRIRGEAPNDSDDPTRFLGSPQQQQHLSSVLVPPPTLLTLEQYFQRATPVEWRTRITGSYTGWVNPEYVHRYALPKSENEVQHGAVSLGKMRKGAGAGGGGSQAKAAAAASFRTNPNAYFYRLVAPDSVHNRGPWSEEEIDRFVDTSNKYGSGLQWGLFASYIKTRVGYQVRRWEKRKK
jgi:hypothetical protein